jgi:hypothetical protein
MSREHAIPLHPEWATASATDRPVARCRPVAKKGQARPEQYTYNNVVDTRGRPLRFERSSLYGRASSPFRDVIQCAR